MVESTSGGKNRETVTASLCLVFKGRGRNLTKPASSDACRVCDVNFKISKFQSVMVRWKTRSAECGVRSAECGVWKMQSVENEECGK